MRIAHLAPWLNISGTRQMPADLACALQDAGTINYLIAPANEMTSRIKAAGVTHLSCRRPDGISILREITRLRQYVQGLRPNILQVYSPGGAWLAKAALRQLEENERPHVCAALTAFPNFWPVNHGLQYCDTITAVSRELRRYVQRLNSLRNKPQPWVIPYGVNELLCSPEYRVSEEWLNQWQRSQSQAANCFTLCVTGPATPLHGFEDLAPIITSLRRRGIPAHAFIVADTRVATPAYLESLKSRFTTADVARHITWLGARSDLRDIISVCHATLSLTRKPASYDRAILEALALGRPVAGYDLGAVGEFLQIFLPDGRIPAGDINAMADRLMTWYTEPPPSPRQVPYPYRLTDMAQSYIGLYQRVLGM